MFCCEVVIIGAGPAGLFQVFELGLLGLEAHVIDAMPQAGGQCIELYPDKPIYDIPALPSCSGRELIARLQQQIRPFAPHFHFGQTVSALERGDDGRYRLRTSDGLEFDTSAVIIAGGIGAFAPRTLALPEAAPLVGHALHYKVTDATRFDGKDIVVAGGGDAALDWTLALAKRARSLVLVHRSATFRAAPASVTRMRALVADGCVQLCEGDIVGLTTAERALREVRVRERSGMVWRIDAAQLLVFWGLHPALGPIADWGMALERQQLAVDPATFQTSLPGVFAVGDINTYPGKKKLILSAFHEAALCAFAAHAHVRPTSRTTLQYTTTSPALQRRLGVIDGADDDTRAEPAARAA